MNETVFVTVTGTALILLVSDFTKNKSYRTWKKNTQPLLYLRLCFISCICNISHMRHSACALAPDLPIRH